MVLQQSKRRPPITQIGKWARLTKLHYNVRSFSKGWQKSCVVPSAFSSPALAKVRSSLQSWLLADIQFPEYGSLLFAAALIFAHTRSTPFFSTFSTLPSWLRSFRSPPPSGDEAKMSAQAGQSFAHSSAPIRPVREVQFGILSPEEIVGILQCIPSLVSVSSIGC